MKDIKLTDSTLMDYCFHVIQFLEKENHLSLDEGLQESRDNRDKIQRELYEWNMKIRSYDNEFTRFPKQIHI